MYQENVRIAIFTIGVENLKSLFNSTKRYYFHAIFLLVKSAVCVDGVVVIEHVKIRHYDIDWFIVFVNGCIRLYMSIPALKYSSNVN